jgi:hypothetical protein
MTTRFQDVISQLKKQSEKASSDQRGLSKLIQSMNAFLSRGITIDLNTEHGELDRLVNADQSTIFIANHPRPLKDGSNNACNDLPVTFAFIGNLYKRYNQKNVKAPGMAYVMSERIPNSFPDDFKSLFHQAGAVGVDATIYPSAERAKTNGKAMVSTIDGFKADKKNIFILPEGGRARYKKELPMPARYQYGVGKTILSVLQSGKPEVKVVSVGFTPNRFVNIGSSLYFKKGQAEQGHEQILVAKENNVTGEKTEYRPISHGTGIVTLQPGNKKADKLMSRLIAGITCDSLEESVKQAEARDPKKTPPKVSSTYDRTSQSPTEILADVSQRLLKADISAPMQVQSGFVRSTHSKMKPKGEFSITYSAKGPVKFRLLENKTVAELQKLESSDGAGHPLKVNVLTVSKNKVRWHTVERTQADRAFAAPGQALTTNDKSVVRDFKELFKTMRSKQQ